MGAVFLHTFTQNVNHVVQGIVTSGASSLRQANPKLVNIFFISMKSPEGAATYQPRAQRGDKEVNT